MPYVVTGNDDADLTPSDEDNATFVPRSVVTSPFFDWGHDRPPRTPWDRTIVPYETHVHGYIVYRGEGIDPELRGTYAGLADPAGIAHLHRPGCHRRRIAAGAPIRARRVPPHERGLRNYWGYNSIAYLAPHNAYSSTGSAW